MQRKSKSEKKYAKYAIRTFKMKYMKSYEIIDLN